MNYSNLIYCAFALLHCLPASTVAQSLCNSPQPPCKAKEKNGRKYYACAFKHLKCNARLITVGDGADQRIVKQSGSHAHTPKQDVKLNVVFMNEIKAEIRATPEKSAHEAYKTVRRRWAPTLNQEMELDLKPFNIVRTNLQQYRRRIHNEGPPDQPLSGVLVVTLKNEPFVIMDSITRVGRVVVFVSPFALEKMRRTPLILMDGTFSTAPQGFAQVYTMHFQFMGGVFQAAYALLPKKNKETYVIFLEAILAEMQRVNGEMFIPDVAQVDFESAMIEAIRFKMPLTMPRGCYFHFTQAIYRHAVDCGLGPIYKSEYSSGGSVRKYVQRVSALPFLLDSQIDETWYKINELVLKEPHCQLVREGLTALQHYVDRTWISSNAMYKRDLWNHYFNDGRRTTNDAEGFHSALVKIMNKHGSVAQFARKLRVVESDNASKLYSAQSNPLNYRRASKFAERDKKLALIKKEYEDGTIDNLEYLDQCRCMLHPHIK